LASQVLGRLRRSGQIDVPVITFLTDMSVHRLWVADGVDAHLALHAVAAAQAQQFGAQGVQVGGPAVSPQFRPVHSRSEQDALRHRFGLPMGTPLALVVAGSWGVGDIESTVDDIARCGVATPVVACGHNDELYRRLKQAGTAIPVGWTDEMACLVRACDVVVQNAGGLSSLEARACGLPVLTYRCLPGHGQTNAAALDEAGWALWIQTPEELRTALKSAVVGELSGSFGNRRLGRTATAAELSVDPAVAIAALVPARVGVPGVSCG
jgi:UDP-N-acetylglucosamine:LPS N-acetylglucosamine transferase